MQKFAGMHAKIRICSPVKIRRTANSQGLRIRRGCEISQPLQNCQGILHLSVMLPVLPFSALIPIDFFMLELNPYLWYK